eukprot:TRINITY_DN4199_c0_g1_i1.p1 TRINITY_DN4199_c0_g1~~TRINITY_DN4199_c0_g1_i1.p1  ORF type:complete len:339 (-),score=36.22 TRINITY_DN4199_c0_g1_i1:14-1030(-)
MAVAEGRGGSGAPQAAASGSDGQEATKPSVCSLLQELAGVKSLRRGLVLNLSKGKLEEKAQRTFPAREAAAGGGPARQAYDVRQAALAKPSRQAQQERASRSRSPKNSRREKEKARSSSRESSGSTASSAVAPHEVAVGAKVKLQLSKMGEFCCNAMATLVKQGGKESRLLPDKLEINQRTKVENCRQHLELVGLASSYYFLRSDHEEASTSSSRLPVVVSRVLCRLRSRPSRLSACRRQNLGPLARGRREAPRLRRLRCPLRLLRQEGARRPRAGRLLQLVHHTAYEKVFEGARPAYIELPGRLACSKRQDGVRESRRAVLGSSKVGTRFGFALAVV